MIVMETASQLMPIIFYLLLSILVVFVIVFVYKLTITLDKTNTLLDDIYSKVRKLDNLFDVIDRSADTLNMITNKVSDAVIGAIMKIFKRKKDDNYE